MLAWLLSSTRRRVACCSGWTPCNHSYGCSLDSLAIRLGGPYGRALPAHGPARGGAGASHHRDDDAPRDGDDILAGEGRGRVTSPVLNVGLFEPRSFGPRCLG